jgi:prepilin-type N-terminal cleavage/methylation domain-containing protein
MTTRRGFTMIELMMGLVLTLLVGGVTFKLLANNQRVSRGQNARVGLQDNVRAGALIVANELREVGYDSVPAGAGMAAIAVAPSTDLLIPTGAATLQPGKIQYRAMRGFGVTCATPTSAQIKLRRTMYYGSRNPVANDSVTMYVEKATNTLADDAWVRAKINSVAAGNCTDGNAAIVLNLLWPNPPGVGGTAAANMLEGGPVRVFDVMEMKYYASNGKMWLGMKSLTAGGNTEPVVGPLSDSTTGPRGLTFQYLNNAGADASATPNNVRTVLVTLRGITDERVRGSGAKAGKIDTLSVQTRVALRNTLRP